jgi:hypothetical protein
LDTTFGPLVLAVPRARTATPRLKPIFALTRPPVRFDTDHMSVTFETYRLHNWQQIPIIELRT